MPQNYTQNIHIFVHYQFYYLKAILALDDLNNRKLELELP